MATFHVLLRRDGPLWDASVPMEEQSGWEAHATFMDGLVERGVVVLGGPLADERRVVLVMEAGTAHEAREILAGDPWADTHLVLDTVEPWTIRLGGRRSDVGAAREHPSDG